MRAQATESHGRSVLAVEGGFSPVVTIDQRGRARGAVGRTLKCSDNRPNGQGQRGCGGNSEVPGDIRNGGSRADPHGVTLAHNKQLGPPHSYLTQIDDLNGVM